MRTTVLTAIITLMVLGGMASSAVVSQWNCNQEAGSATLIDQVGSANGTLEDKTYGPPPNRMTFVTSGAGLVGDYGNALWTDNLNDRANLGEVDAFDFGKGDFTVTGWFNSSNSARHGCIIRHGWWDIGGFDVVVLKTNGRISFEVFGPTANKSVVSTDVKNNGQWHWFAGVVKNEAMYLYIDGVLEANSGVTFDPGTTASVTGQSTFINMDMAGSVDHLTIYNTALTGTLDANNTLISGELYFDWYGMPLTGPTTCQEVLNAGYQNIADLNGDCKVNLQDFAMMAALWLYCNDPADINCSRPWQD